MANEPVITMMGNITDDPEMRFTQSGTAVANFTVAQTPRYRDSKGEWADGETIFMKITAWGQLAEGCAESLRKGDRVNVTGTLFSQRWEDDEGMTRYRLGVTATDVSASILFRNVVIVDEKRSEPPTPQEKPGPKTPAKKSRTASRSRTSARNARENTRDPRGEDTGEAPF